MTLPSCFVVVETHLGAGIPKKSSSTGLFDLACKHVVYPLSHWVATYVHWKMTLVPRPVVGTGEPPSQLEDSTTLPSELIPIPRTSWMSQRIYPLSPCSMGCYEKMESLLVSPEVISIDIPFMSRYILLPGAAGPQLAFIEPSGIFLVSQWIYGTVSYNWRYGANSYIFPLII